MPYLIRAPGPFDISARPPVAASALPLTFGIAGATPVYRWMRELLALGLVPSLAVIETVSADRWGEAERRHIAARSGLLNIALGGSQPFCPRKTCASNGKATAASRNHRLWYLKLRLAQALRSGFVSPSLKAKMQARPDLFGQMLATNP